VPQGCQERSQWLFQHDSQSIAIQRCQPLDTLRFPLHEISSPLNTLEELGHSHRPVETEETHEGVDHIVRRHFPTMMKRDPSAQGEGPSAAILGSFPKLGKGGNGLEEGIKLDQAVEDLADDGAAIGIGHQGGVERDGVVGQYPAERPSELRARYF
jgi:hypothetical protein